jgi:hypothetical protein
MGRLFVIIILLLLALTGHAQEEAELVNDTLRTHEVVLSADSTSVNTDQTTLNMDSIARSPEDIPIKVDTTKQVKLPRNWSTWKPNPQRALWLALVLPGAGQIYNRKFWKLPIFYGGFLGCIYALSWNNMMYKDYSQAYLDIMDDDPTTASYNKFLHLGVQITSANENRYKEIFKGRKDKYRRWRDMSIFVMIGIYALSVIDAYVDAELSEFDISKDLSLEIHPTVIPNRGGGNPIQAQSVGFSCFLNF